MSKTIRLDEDTYERLKAAKRADETFSEAVERLLGGGSLLDLVGFWSDEEVESIRDVLDDVDAASKENLDDLLDRVGDGGNGR